MPKEEYTQPPRRPRAAEIFGLTRNEQLFDQVSHARLMAFVADETVTVHKVEETYNNYGGFLFVTLSKEAEGRRVLLTMWGQGFHESRERWLLDEWFWYEAHPFPQTLEKHIANAEAKRQIEAHRASIAPETRETTQSKRGQMFELLADLTDEDGAAGEIEDLPWWLLADDAE